VSRAKRTKAPKPIPAAVEGANIARQAAEALAEVYWGRGRAAASVRDERRWYAAVRAAGVTDRMTGEALGDAHWDQINATERRAFAVGFHAGLRLAAGR
jgi:hypothetical protein